MGKGVEVGGGRPADMCSGVGYCPGVPGPMEHTSTEKGEQAAVCSIIPCPSVVDVPRGITVDSWALLPSPCSGQALLRPEKTHSREQQQENLWTIPENCLQANPQDKLKAGH